MDLRDLHVTLGWAIVVGNATVGAWALAAHWLDQLRHRALWWATAVAQIIIVLQIIVGVITMRANDVEVGGTHLFYGFVSAFAVGLIYSYRQQIERWQYLLYGFGGLFLMGMALRTIYIPALS